MKNLVILEKYSRHWPDIAKTSMVLAVIFGIACYLSDDVLIEGYLRLAAFCSFALAVLSFFKVREGRIQIGITLKEGDVLELDYQVREKRIEHRTYKLNEIDSVEISKMPDRTFYNNLATNDRTIMFKKQGTDDWLYLTAVRGRAVPLDGKNAEQMKEFINQILAEHS